MELKKYDGALEVHSSRCHSWLCPVCREKRGYQVRKFLREHLDFFRVPKLFTLTLNPDNFESPLDALKRVRENAFIPRLMRFLGIKTWFAVLEFQKNGFPHWHILIDVSPLPQVGKIQHYLDLEKVFKLWRFKWSLGTQIHLTEKHSENSLHAVNYISKYLIKSPSCGYPEWVWNTLGIRMFSSSKGLSLSKKKDFGKFELNNEIADCEGFWNEDNKNNVADCPHKSQSDSSENLDESEDSEYSKGVHKTPNVLRVCLCGSNTFITSDGHFICKLPVPLDFLEGFDCIQYSQSDDDGCIYSSRVVDKSKGGEFLNALLSDDLTFDISNYLDNYALNKAKQLKIMEIYKDYAVAF